MHHIYYVYIYTVHVAIAEFQLSVRVQCNLYLYCRAVVPVGLGIPGHCPGLLWMLSVTCVHIRAWLGHGGQIHCMYNCRTSSNSWYFTPKVHQKWDLRSQIFLGEHALRLPPASTRIGTHTGLHPSICIVAQASINFYRHQLLLWMTQGDTCTRTCLLCCRTLQHLHSPLPVSLLHIWVSKVWPKCSAHIHPGKVSEYNFLTTLYFACTW